MVGEHTYRFSNTTNEWTQTANGKPKPNFEHFKKVIEHINDYDLILVCGLQAKQTVDKFKEEILSYGKPLMFVPHPAARNLSNVKIAQIRQQIEIISKRK